MAVNPVKTPFTNMSFTPDVPSSALGANEYNQGYNIETNVRGVNSVAGDEFILNGIPGNVIYITSGFRNNNVWWFVAATEQGEWYAMNESGDVTDITPQPIPGILSPTLTTFTSLTGTSGNISTHSNVSPTTTSGAGTGATFDISVISTGAPYSAGGAFTAGFPTGVYNLVGTTSAGAAAGHPWTGNAVNLTGSGVGAVFSANITANSSSYSTHTSLSVVNGGYNYTNSNNIKILGSQLGGTTPANDLSMVINSAGLGSVTTITLNQPGKNYVIGDTITIAGTQLGGTSPANDLTFTLSGQVISMPVGDFTGYSANTVITSNWSGQTLFINDQLNPPLYLTSTATELGVYDYPDPQTGQTYVWNYNVTTDSSGNIIPLYSSLTAGFQRLWNSPNVGSLLIAGNLTGEIAANVVYPTPGTIQQLPTTVRWSQNFGLNSGPTTWAPTLTNVANEVEIPVRGPVVDGFPLNGSFYVMSYWDCVQFSPIAYTSSTAPIFGILLVNQGRGLLNENCWVNVDNSVFGIDARDIWQFDGGNFKAIGNQRVKDYFYNNINSDYINQVFMVHNSAKYQIEIYYPDLYSIGYCNQMLAYRYDLDAWQPPRQVENATQGTESPRFYGNVINLATRGVVYSTIDTDISGNTHLIQKDTGTSFLYDQPITTLFQRNNITFGQPYSASVQVHRVLPEVYGTGNIQITIGGNNSVASEPTFKPTIDMPIITDNPWVQIDQNENRVITMQVSSNSAVDSWQMTAANWQVTVVQDTR